MFSWASKDGRRKNEPELFNTVADGLRKLYNQKLLPLEETYRFHDFHSPALEDADFHNKPMVLLVGQYSTGKTTFIRHLMEQDFPGMRIGPEPTTDSFIAVMHGPVEGVLPGNALVVDPKKPFRKLSAFGNAFLNRFMCAQLPNPVLESISIIDTPGILSGEKQRISRGYDFAAVLEWFAERVDRIILLFDAHKLDISDEFSEVIKALKNHEDKIRVVLNKADQIETQQLMRVYGALMWSLGKIINTPEVVRVYIGSFWSHPLLIPDNRKLFEAEEQDLFKDIQSLPRNAALRKLNDLIKRARLAKVHAYIISALKKEMPNVFGKDNKKKELINNLAEIYLKIEKEQQISPGDFPNLRKMQEILMTQDFSKFQSIKPKLLDAVDDMLANDIAKLMVLVRQEESQMTNQEQVRKRTRPSLRPSALQGCEEAMPRMRTTSYSTAQSRNRLVPRVRSPNTTKMASTAVVEDEEGKKRRAHGMLKLYYGINEEGKSSEKLLDPTDIDGVHFNPEQYLTKLRKEKSLTELMDIETDMVRQIRALDSDMQTLVYENYNKFISATDTIRKMKNDFKKMEDEMDGLATNMAVITEFSARISSTLQERHQHITKLSGVHTLLRKLQFLFELPARLKKCIELGAYVQAVTYHAKARSVLHQYQHMPSFHGIQTDCQAIMAGLADTLRQRFRDPSSSPQDLSECVELLLSLEEPAHLLCDEFLAHGRGRLASHLSELEGASDILEFVDRGCGGFISDACLLAASYQSLFCKEPGSTAQMAEEKLTKFLDRLSEGYFELVEKRLREEKNPGDNSLLVRALDRFHRRLQAPSKLVPGCSFNRRGTEIVVRAAQERLSQYLQTLKDFFQACITDVRQALAAPRVPGKEAPALGELLAVLSGSVLNQIKSVLASVHLFTAKDVAFSDKPYFKGEFCSQGVREGLIVAFIKSVCQTARQFCDSPGEKGANTPPLLLLLLSRLCLDYETSTISYILTLTDEQFLGQDHSPVTPVSTLCSLARSTAQTLLNQYVKSQGLVISQMLRKSVETRDWVTTIEPRNVRAVMKRVVEDITGVDVQVGLLYEEGVRKAHSSDSSKRTFSVYSSSRLQGRYAQSYTPSAPLDTNLLSNIQKLFSERIDIFSTVQFNKVSILTGIIKISLKTFLECVRLRTFGRFGLQQIQVDCHYLQLYLWRFVSDENLVHCLLDEVVGSAAHRCLDPAPMEQSVIEVICERG